MAFETAPAGLVVFDRAGAVQTANQAGATLLGPLGAGNAPEGWFAALDGPSRQTWNEHLRAVFETGEPITSTLTLAGPRGTARHLTAQSAPAAAGCCTTVFLEAPQADRATELLREKNAFVARLSHELRSALASMVGFADLLRDQADQAHGELVDLIRLSGRHLLETLNAVMELARLDVGEAEAPRARVDVVARVRDRMAVIRPLAAARGLTVSWEAEVDEAVALLNPTFLDRVVHNLLDNAVKYTAEGGLRVRVASRAGFVWVYVADTGGGIDAAFQPRLFTPFTREHQGGRVPDGIGLGLAITRSLVERMDGHILVCSERGAGSTFALCFPLAG